MKIFFVFITVCVLSVSSLFAEEFDIRELKWGMSFEEVQKIENLDTNFYKEEDILGLKVEVLFGCDNKGLYSVSYSTRDRLFGQEARKVMIKKYGEPKFDFEYSYLVKLKSTLEKYPDEVIPAVDSADFSGLDVKGSVTGSGGNEKSILRYALTKREMWEFNRTTALLLDTIEGAALVYWSKTYHLESKKKFYAFIEELRKKVTKKIEKKSEEGEKF